MWWPSALRGKGRRVCSNVAQAMMNGLRQGFRVAGLLIMNIINAREAFQTLRWALFARELIRRGLIALGLEDDIRSERQIRIIRWREEVANAWGIDDITEHLANVPNPAGGAEVFGRGRQLHMQPSGERSMEWSVE